MIDQKLAAALLLRSRIGFVSRSSPGPYSASLERPGNRSMPRRQSPVCSLWQRVASPIGFAIAPITVSLMARSSWLLVHCFSCEQSVLFTFPHWRYGFRFSLACRSHSGWSGASPGNVNEPGRDRHPFRRANIRSRCESVLLQEPTSSIAGEASSSWTS